MIPLPPPAIVIVFSAPVPEATTPAPTKFSVVAAVDNAPPSSLTESELPPPPPEIVIVFVAPVPDATTPDPTKLIVEAAVDSDEPSS